MTSHKSITSLGLTYKLVPPEGGWGHLITLSLIIMNLVTLSPLSVFGLIFSGLLRKIGDETAATTLSNGVLNTVQSFTGIASSFLLKKYSYRKVGFIGAFFYSLGAMGNYYFVNSLGELIFFYGVIQGCGSGLLLPASFTAFQSFFDRKLNLMTGISQAIIILGTMCYPPIASALLDCVGYQNTLIIIGALSLLNFPAMALMQPVTNHLKKIPIELDSKLAAKHFLRDKYVRSQSVCDEVLRSQTKPLTQNRLINEISSNQKTIMSVEMGSEIIFNQAMRRSIISMGSNHLSVTNLHGENIGRGEKDGCLNLLNLTLFKSPKYINMAFGLALPFSSDIAFIPMIPLLLKSKGLDASDVSFLMTVYYGTDLCARIIFSLASAFCKINNRYVFLAGTTLSAVFRLVFVYCHGYTSVAVTTCILGFLRCFIQTPLPLVISEEYSDDFSTAYSLFMVVCGFVNLVLGLLMSYIKMVTNNEDLVMHVMTAAFLLCSISWTIELIWQKLRRKTARK